MDNISWDKYFMGVALLSGLRSKDPNSKVGACIVNRENKIVGVGYNGFPTKSKDDDFKWDREGAYLNTKYPFVVHAELNAILNSTSDLKECTIYVGLFPCNECAKAIIQSGISRVVYKSDKYKDKKESVASKRLLDSCGVSHIEYKSKDDIILDFYN